MRRRATFRQRKAYLVGAGAAFVLLVLTPLSIIASPDPRIDACGGRQNTVVTTFQMDAASDFWKHFPAALAAPELAGDDRPAFVAVFGPDFKVPALAAPGPEGLQILQDVVCVITADGVPNLYWDISKAGSRFANP